MRNYILQPLQKDNKGHFIEMIPYEEVYQQYIVLNKSLKECYKYFNISPIGFQRTLKYYGIKKSTKQIYENYSNTVRKQYGVDNVFQIDEVKRVIDTNKRKTILSKYGVDNVFQIDEVKNKAKTTKLLKYNDEYYCNKDKISETLTNYFKSINFKVKKPYIIKKIYETKRKNMSSNLSKEEEHIYHLLVQKFPDTQCQYKDERYPFACDFYIPSKDLFIEYQGYPSHGGEPFIGSPKQLEKVKLWESKANQNDIEYNNKRKSDYHNYIKTWTLKDVEKRKIALMNSLNWLEFFNTKEFMDWYNTQ